MSCEKSQSEDWYVKAEKEKRETKVTAVVYLLKLNLPRLAYFTFNTIFSFFLFLYFVTLSHFLSRLERIFLISHFTLNTNLQFNLLKFKIKSSTYVT